MTKRLNIHCAAALLGIVFLTSVATVTYAGVGSHSTRVRTVETQSLAGPRAYLALEGSPAPHPLDVLPHVGSGSTSLESLAYKISFVGGLLLTAESVAHTVGSFRDVTAYRRPDGSCFRFNAEPSSHGFMVGLTMSRPIDF